MAQERWRLNDTSYSVGSAITRDGTSAGNSEWFLVPLGTAASSTTSSWEGSRALLTPNPAAGNVRFRTTNVSTDLTAGIYIFDALVFIPTGVTGAISLGVCANDTAVEYSWAELVASGGNYQVSVKSFDTGAGTVTRSAAVTAGAVNNWCRVRVTTTAKGVLQAELWTGLALPTDANGGNEGATATATTAQWAGGTFSNWQYFLLYGDAPPSDIRIDDVIFNSNSNPTRLPPNVQAALSETATLTSAASRTAVVTAAPSTTATMTALAGKVITAQAALAATAATSTDAAVVTTHTAEAYLAVAGAMTPDTTRSRVADVALTTAAALSSRVTTNDSAVLTASAAMTAWVRIEGEQSPGQLKSRVRTTTITG